MKSVLSRAVLTGVLLTSTAGWLGLQLDPSLPAQAASEQVNGVSGATTTGQTAVRDRSAWQPSPVPSTSGAVAAAPAAQAEVPAAVQAAAMPAAVVSAAPAAPAAPSLSLPERITAWLKGLFGVQTTAPEALSVEAVPGANTVIPMESLYNHDALAATFAGALPTARGEWRTVTFYSRALGREDSYLAWLPPGYAASGRTYPTLYLLHGVGSAEAYGAEEWLGYALTEDLDRMLALGLIEPMIVVLPNGEQGYWMNHANGGPRWSDFVAKDLVASVDATLRTTATRETRAIGGLSMGGHGALQIAYNHPELFSVAGAHSPTIRSFETSPEFFGDAAHFAKYDPISLALSGKTAPRLLTWIDVGADDKWRAGAETLAGVLTARNAPLQFRVIEGEHEGWYWKHYLPQYLSFYSNALNAGSRTQIGAPVVVSQLLDAAASPASL